MKVLLSVIMMILFLIMQPAKAGLDYVIRFENQKSSPKDTNVLPFKPVESMNYNFSRINDACIKNPGPLNFTLDKEPFTMTIQDINSGACVGKQKKIIWVVSTKNFSAASLDPDACLVQWSVTLYWPIPNWNTAVTSTCGSNNDFIIKAMCPSKNCYNYCSDLNDCHMENIEYVSGSVNGNIIITFEEKPRI
ncbi:exported protein of unknown function [Xenorhabdus poinarii G6]|uniref:Uncharacterized protein n=1 Tax=Xenorhabdus poinarii G6 TaxID=1354304 RepID=A0A068R002_9GAMM|nr:hypothetical protein [Xenorhabdus poinarii]CDG20622.1 exported protein of unknown function [Xenorhabdus poinarii G6]